MPLSNRAADAAKRRQAYIELRRQGHSPDAASIEVGIDEVATRKRYEQWWLAEPDAITPPAHDEYFNGGW